jgi:hypothetical protein
MIPGYGQFGRAGVVFYEPSACKPCPHGTKKYGKAFPKMRRRPRDARHRPNASNFLGVLRLCLFFVALTGIFVKNNRRHQRAGR